MGIFSRIFGIRKINNISSDLDKKQNDNIVELLELKSFLDELLKKNLILLYEYAEEFKIQSILKNYMEVL